MWRNAKTGLQNIVIHLNIYIKLSQMYTKYIEAKIDPTVWSNCNFQKIYYKLNSVSVKVEWYHLSLLNHRDSRFNFI